MPGKDPIHTAKFDRAVEHIQAAGKKKGAKQADNPYAVAMAALGPDEAIRAKHRDPEDKAEKAASPPPVGVPRKPKLDPGTVKQERDAAKKIEEEAGTAQPSRADMAKARQGLSDWLNDGGIMRRSAARPVKKAEEPEPAGDEAAEDDAKEKKTEQRIAQETGDVSTEDEEAAEARAERMDKGRPMGQPKFGQPAADPPAPMEAPEPQESPLPTARTGQTAHAKVRPSVTPAAKTIQQVPAVPRGEAQHAGEDPHGAMSSGTQDARMGKAGLVGGGGEGSRGGHIVGHTSSGQPIYAAAGGAHESKAAEHASHKAAESGSAKDHLAAQRAHQVAARARHEAGNAALGAYHERQSQQHARLAGDRGFKEAMTIKRSDEGGRGLANWLCKAIPGTEGAGARMPMSGGGPNAGPGIPGTEGAEAELKGGKASRQAAAGEGSGIPGTEGSPQPPVGGSQALGASRPGKGQEAGIPGAEDVPGGQPPGHDLPSGDPDMVPGPGVNGADLADAAFDSAPPADGAVLSRTGPGKLEGTPETSGASEADAGKVTRLNPDEHDGSSIEGEPGITEEDAGPDGQAMRTVGANRGQVGSDLSKSTRVLDASEVQYANRVAAERAGRAAPRDVVHQPALPAPRLKKAEPPAPTIQLMNGTVYSTASDDAVDRLMNGGDGFYHGDAPALGVGGRLLQKGAACGRCGGTVPSFLTVCPQCGGGGGLTKAMPTHAPMQQKGRLRAPARQDFYLPNGLAPKR